MMSGRAFLPEPDFDRLARRVIERTGHHYYADKPDLLWDRLSRRLHETRLRGCAEYLERLNDPVKGEAEWSALEAEITIGETFFFRYAEQFAALRQTILPDLIQRNAQTRRIRIWSAGCANGAEPYSVAILLKELLGEAAADWRISILGTDINLAALKAARQARFTAWSLRSIPPAKRPLYFLQDKANGWSLRPEFRALVRFERQNLMCLLDSAAPLHLTGYDLILCRNVLIYFHPDVVFRLMGALRDRLTPGGWMLIGHAEPNHDFGTLLSHVALPGTTAYRRAPPPMEMAPTEVPEVGAASIPPPARLASPILLSQPAPEAPPEDQGLADSIARLSRPL
jgi:chemotaxis protein methyltransferase CheR